MSSLGGPEPHLNILRFGHRHPYQMENAMKQVGMFFFYLLLGLNSLQGSCCYVYVENWVQSHLVG